MIVRDFLICLLQMYLLEDLEKNMLPYRRENFWGKFLVYFVVALIMLGINHLESSIFNMVMIPVTYMIVSMVVFRGNIYSRICRRGGNLKNAGHEKSSRRIISRA